MSTKGLWLQEILNTKWFPRDDKPLLKILFRRMSVCVCVCMCVEEGRLSGWQKTKNPDRHYRCGQCGPTGQRSISISQDLNPPPFSKCFSLSTWAKSSLHPLISLGFSEKEQVCKYISIHVCKKKRGGARKSGKSLSPWCGSNTQGRTEGRMVERQQLRPPCSLKQGKWGCSVLSDSATPWTVAHQAPPSMEFSRQESWSGVPFPPPGDLPNPGIRTGPPTLQAASLPSELPGKPTVQSKKASKEASQRPRKRPWAKASHQRCVLVS